MTGPRRALTVRGLILLAFVALLFVFSRHVPQPFTAWVPAGDVDDFDTISSSHDKLRDFLNALGPYSPAVFVLFQVLQVIAAPFPGELTGVVGGYVYGKTIGFILSTIGLTLGSWIAFELASILGRPFVERFVKQEVLHKFDFLTTNTGAAICFLMFVFPGFPKDYLCYLLGLSRMRLTTFLIVSAIGRLPGTYLLAMQGASIRNQQYYAALFVAVLSAAVLLLAYLYRRQIYDWIKRWHEE